MKPKVIIQRTWQGKQSWNHELIEQIDKVQLRYRVEVDCYDFQSSAKVEVWKDMEWSLVHRIPGQELKLGFSGYANKVRAEQFGPAIDELRRVAKAVLGL